MPVYNIGDAFILNKIFIMRIIDITTINKNKHNKYYEDNTYSVNITDFNGNIINNKRLATYNFISNNRYKYVMKENDFSDIHIIKV